MFLFDIQNFLKTESVLLVAMAAHTENAVDGLIDEEAQRAISLAISQQPILVPLEEMGPAEFNRFSSEGTETVNGKHAVELINSIITKKGFSNMKYRHGFCHEPDPLDPFRVARIANKNCTHDEFLPTYDVSKALKGVFGCTHLMTGLQVQKGGKTTVPSTGRVLKPTEGNEAHQKALRAGLLMISFDYAVVQRHRPLIDALMASANQDSDLTLSGDEVSVIQHLKGTWGDVLQKRVQVTPGLSLEDTVSPSCPIRLRISKQSVHASLFFDSTFSFVRFYRTHASLRLIFTSLV